MILLNRASLAEKNRNKKTQPVFTAGNFNKALGTLAATCIALPAPVVEGVSGLQ